MKSVSIMPFLYSQPESRHGTADTHQRLGADAAPIRYLILMMLMRCSHLGRHCKKQAEQGRSMHRFSHVFEVVALGRASGRLRLMATRLLLVRLSIDRQ